MNQLFLVIHNIFYLNIVATLGRLIAPLIGLTIVKVSLGLKNRKKKNGQWPWLVGKVDSPIWIHVSSGEFEYAKPVIREIKNLNANQKIILTYFSPSVVKNVEKSGLVDAFFAAPFESRKLWQEFLEFHKPKMLLLARTDFWPEMIISTFIKKVPIFLFSARLSQESSKLKNPILKAYYGWLFSFIEKVFAVTREDKLNFQKLLPENKILVLGDARYDQVKFRLNHPNKLDDTIKPKSPIFLAGSTWPEDEAILLEALPKILNLGISFVIAPHEPSDSHIELLCRKLSDLKIEFQLYNSTAGTKSLANSKPTNVVIINQVGILAELYSWADFAFVGNSFVSPRIHSVMEPLGCGCITFFGPHFSNNREAIDFDKEKLCYSFATSNELIEYLKSYLDKEVRKNLQTKIQFRFNSNLGASQAIAKTVLNYESQNHPIDLLITGDK